MGWTTKETRKQEQEQENIVWRKMINMSYVHSKFRKYGDDLQLTLITNHTDLMET